MPHEVRMPQLGMTQDSGIVVSWLKAEGEAVAEGEALFEVETDKATMEVAAQVSGFLTGVRAREGDDVPVGDVIALIVETSAEAREYAALSPEAGKPACEPPLPPKPEDKTASDSETVPIPPPAPASGKILASPKAKRLGLERGIDLAMLRAHGAAEPIRAADLERAVRGGQSCLAAGITGTAFNALISGSENADRTALFAAFATGAWRALFNADAGVVVRALDGTTSVVGDKETALALVDLCDTRLIGYVPSGGGITLSAARQGDGYRLTLTFPEATLPFPQAAALLDAIAARVENPIRQIL